MGLFTSKTHPGEIWLLNPPFSQNQSKGLIKRSHMHHKHTHKGPALHRIVLGFLILYIFPGVNVHLLSASALRAALVFLVLDRNTGCSASHNLFGVPGSG